MSRTEGMDVEVSPPANVDGEAPTDGHEPDRPADRAAHQAQPDQGTQPDRRA